MRVTPPHPIRSPQRRRSPDPPVTGQTGGIVTATFVLPERPGAAASSRAPHCRFCGSPLSHLVVDLGMSPPCERYLRADQLDELEPFYPLRVHVCDRCLLVQLQQYVSPQEIFSEYAYFSSYSSSWVEHARRYCELMIDRFGLGPRSLVAEDRRADLLVANNVLAQVPDLNDFVAGMRALLAPRGVATVEFPHLARLFEGNQFDTIYHEHFSYFSLLVAERVFGAHGLVAFDVEELPTHGGSLRVYLRHAEDDSKPVRPSVAAVAAREADEGFGRLEHYLSFGPRVEATKRRLLSFLIQARDRGRRTAGYGAPGKGNTLLNYCGIRTDLLDYTVDRNPYKQGRYLPGTHVPVHDPSLIARTRPDYVLILPWNLKDEVVAQLAEVRSWGGRFVVPIPEVTVL